MARERIIWVDRMRGLAIFSVVIVHLTFAYANNFAYHKLFVVSNLAVFFFVSGYIWSKTSTINTPQQALTFLLKKSRELLIPLIAWQILTPYFFTTHWQLPTTTDLIQIFTKPHLWFLLTLYGYCFYFAIFKLIDKWGVERHYILDCGLHTALPRMEKDRTFQV